MPVSDYIRLRKAIQYTGSNGAEISAFANTPIVLDNGVHLKLGDPGSGYVAFTMNVGDYYESTDGSAWQGSVFDSSFVTKASTLLDTDTVYNPTALTNRVAATEASVTGLTNSMNGLSNAANGKLSKVDLVSISVPLLLLLGTADRPIVWNRPFSDANYQLSYAFDASTIGRITCAPVAGTKTANGITIRVTASLLAVSVLGVVHVMGIGA